MFKTNTLPIVERRDWCMLSAKGARVEHKRALVIGISQYENNELQSLSFCENDGQEVHELLDSLGYEVTDSNRLIGEVDGFDLRRAIINFFTDRSVRANDTLIMYYSGHGIPDVDEDVYLASSDIDPRVPAMYGFSFDELTKMMQNSISKRVITILDCCYSGSAKLGAKSGNDAAKLGTRAISKGAGKLQQGEGRCLLAASRSSEQAYGSNRSGHSIFTYFLLEGLGGAEEALDKDRNVTPVTLGNYLYDMVTENLPDQRPIIKVEMSGRIILATYPIISPNPLELFKEASGYLSNNYYDKALACYKKIVDIDPKNTRSWNNMGKIYEDQRKFDDALRCYDKALELDPNDNTIWYNKGNLLYKSERFDDALRSYDSALELEPNDIDSWNNKSCALYKLKRFSEYGTCIDKVKSLNDAGKK